MDIPWHSPEALKFVTNVGLITSHGPHGDNVMSAEWTHQVSYSPGLIAVCLAHSRTTVENIQKTKVFGVNLAALDQNVLTSVSGNSHGNEVDKINTLKELGVTFYPGKKTPCLMISGAALNVECKVVEIIKLGDHTMIVGEALDVQIGDKEPIVFHGGKYWKFGDNIPRPDEKTMEKIKMIVEKNRKK